MKKVDTCTCLFSNIRFCPDRHMQCPYFACILSNKHWSKLSTPKDI